MSQGSGKGSHRRCILATPPFNSLFHHGHGEEREWKRKQGSCYLGFEENGSVLPRL
ncbi:uncharacterized protein DS421_14g467230 [Arachis hypogaea]|nr:uncharacterized protein DS421_14g467230 [Arachis hypogaea]